MRETLPPLHDVLIGAFQVLDKHIVRNKNEKEGEPEPPLLGLELRTSYVDLGFGKNKGTFCGINRFAVTSLEPDDDADISSPEEGGNLTEDGGRQAREPGRLVRLTLSAVACNPTQNATTTSRWVFDMHQVHAMFLFREAVVGHWQIVRPLSIYYCPYRFFVR